MGSKGKSQSLKKSLKKLFSLQIRDEVCVGYEGKRSGCREGASIQRGHAG